MSESKQLCKFKGCDLPTKAKGYCNGHYQQSLYRDTLIPLRKPKGVGECVVPGCWRDIAYFSYCNGHNEQRKRGEEFTDIRTWKHADWYDNGHGYLVRSRMINGRKVTELQHRVVMEEYLGRRLYPNESVHHKNGDRKDNRLANLELWTKTQPAGQRAKDLLAWAESIIAQYGPEREKL